MKFICTQENLVAGLNRTVGIAGRNTQLPILGNVLLNVTDGVLQLTTTDLEVGVKTTVPGKAEEDGGCAVLAKKFNEYIQQLPPNDAVEISATTDGLQVKATSFKAHFPVVVEDEFPPLPTLPKIKPLTFSGNSLADSFRRVIFSAARDDTRPEIHSVYFYLDNNEVVIAATDSFRLAEDRIKESSGRKELALILPLNTAQEVIRLFSETEEVLCYPHENHVVFTSTKTELSSRLVAGSYPDYSQIIPQKFTVTGEVVRADFIRALKTLLVFLPRDSRRMKVLVDPGKDKITLTTGGGEAGEGRVNLEFTGQGDKLEALFNIQYLLDGAQSVQGDILSFNFVGASDPATLGSPQRHNYTYVVMPIQL